MKKVVGIAGILFLVSVCVVCVYQYLNKNTKEADVTQEEQVKVEDVYKSISVTNANLYVVTEESFIAKVESLLLEKPSFKATDKEFVSMNDMVRITMQDMETEDNYDYEVKIGSGVIYSAIESELIGMSVGQEKEVKVLISQENTEAFITKNYKVKLLEIGEEEYLTYDSLTDEYTEKYYEKDKYTYLNDILQEMKLDKLTEKDKDNAYLVLYALEKEVEVTYPEELLQQREKEFEELNTNDKLSEEEKARMVKGYVTQELILQELMNLYGKTYAETDFEMFLYEQAENNSMTEEEICKQYGNRAVARIDYMVTTLIKNINDTVKVSYTEKGTDYTIPQP